MESLKTSAIAKASLYYYPSSIWSTVVLLAVEEKGYGPDEIDKKIVDINKGESYTLSYLRLNPKGTVPCLIVPLEATLASGVDSRYKAITESTAILDFLDKSRSTVSKTSTTSAAPAPSLSPATIVLADTSTMIINLLHSDAYSPFHFVCSARNLQELRTKASAGPGHAMIGRYGALRHLLETADPHVNPKAKEFWEKRSAALKPFAELFRLAGEDDSSLTENERKARQEHYSNSDALWEAEAKRLFATLEKEMVGPMCLGDQLSLVDLHLAAYLTRLVALAGGDGTKGGIDSIPQYAALTAGAVAGARWSIGSKIRMFWECIVERPSWKAIFGAGVY